MEADKIRKTELTIEIDIFGDKLLVSYYPFALEGTDVSMVVPADATPLQGYDWMVSIFPKIVSCWDLTRQVPTYDKEGVQTGYIEESFPLDKDALMTLPFDLLLMVFTAVQNDKDVRKMKSAQTTQIATEEARLNSMSNDEQEDVIRMFGPGGAEEAE